MVVAVLLLILGFAILIKGADFLVSGAASLAKRLRISNLAIGLTIVAFGTSTPELVVNIVSSVTGRNDAVFGNIIGSNNFNLFFIMGVAGMIFPLSVQRNTVRFEVPLSLVAAAALFLLVNDALLFGTVNILSRWDGLLLLGLFGVFMFYIYRTMRNAGESSDGETIAIYSKGKSIGWVTLGLVMLVVGGDLAVDNAVSIAHYFNISEKLIGLTILAIGTSLPELATSVVAAMRKQTDIAVGNVVGSNIFNILFILGITGLIRPAPFNIAMNFDLIVLMVGTLLMIIFMFTINRRVLDRWEAFLLLLGYLVYTVFLIGMEVGALSNPALAHGIGAP